MLRDWSKLKLFDGKYICSFCRQGSFLKDSIRKHIRNKHPEKLESFAPYTLKEKKFCLECNSEIFSINSEKFCNKSCAAKFNNRQREKSGWKHKEESKKQISQTTSEKINAHYNRLRAEGKPAGPVSGKVVIKGKYIPDLIIEKVCPHCNEGFKTSYYKPRLYCKKTSCILKNKSILIKNLIKNGWVPSGGFCKWQKLIDSRNREVKYQGSLEFKYIHCLDRLFELGKIQDWKRSNLRIEYFNGQKERIYLPDFEVLIDGIWEVHEVKGRLREYDPLKFIAAKKNYRFKVLFEKDIHALIHKLFGSLKNFKEKRAVA